MALGVPPLADNSPEVSRRFSRSHSPTGEGTASDSRAARLEACQRRSDDCGTETMVPGVRGALAYPVEVPALHSESTPSGQP